MEKLRTSWQVRAPAPALRAFIASYTGYRARHPPGIRRRQPGNDSVYVVCDDPDGLFERSVAAGVDVVRGLKDEEYGSRGFTVRDPGGVL